MPVIRIDGLRLGGPNGSQGTTRGSMFAYARHVRAVKGVVSLRVAHVWRFAGKPPIAQVRVVRVGPRRLDEDNLVAACKATLDGVAMALGMNDRDFAIVSIGRPGVHVKIEQRSEGQGRYAVEIELTAVDTSLAARLPDRKRGA